MVSCFTLFKRNYLRPTTLLFSLFYSVMVRSKWTHKHLRHIFLPHFLCLCNGSFFASSMISFSSSVSSYDFLTVPDTYIHLLYVYLLGIPLNFSNQTSQIWSHQIFRKSAPSSLFLFTIQQSLSQEFGSLVRTLHFFYPAHPNRHQKLYVIPKISLKFILSPWPFSLTSFCSSISFLNEYKGFLSDLPTTGFFLFIFKWVVLSNYFLNHELIKWIWSSRKICVNVCTHKIMPEIEGVYGPLKPVQWPLRVVDPEENLYSKPSYPKRQIFFKNEDLIISFLQLKFFSDCQSSLR